MSEVAPQLATNKVRLEQLLQQIDALPALPAIVQNLLKAGPEDADIHAMTRLVSLDQALAARTLRFANSSLYGLQARVTTIQQAVTRLGVDAVRHLVAAHTVKDYFSHDCPGFSLITQWRHAVATAVCARVLARHLHVNQEYAFTAGLLHDVGRLVLITHFRQEYEAVIAYRREHDCEWLHAEREVMGIDHTTAGEALAAHWQFADTIRCAIAGHHEPDLQKDRALAGIVHVANVIVHALDLSDQEDDLAPPLSTAAWDALGLEEAAYRQIFHETELLFEEVSRVLLP